MRGDAGPPAAAATAAADWAEQARRLERVSKGRPQLSGTPDQVDHWGGQRGQAPHRLQGSRVQAAILMALDGRSVQSFAARWGSAFALMSTSGPSA